MQEPDINSGRVLIDAVNWDVVSQLHGTRAPKACRQKWYDNLAPSMVTRGGPLPARLRKYAPLGLPMRTMKDFCRLLCLLCAIIACPARLDTMGHHM